MLRSLLAAMAAFALVPATSMAATHTVAPGETLWGIAYANNLPTSAVAAANGLSSEARVVAGTNLTIPAPGQAPTPPVNPAPSSPGTTTAPAASGGGGYRVAPGDT
ncbi:MAG TPA: LysM domain-containing protein, partial [Solirubrobacteraceae bacterium]|nr:LysM domain-containing protein [Solirubrobacteraceae bacterium]